MIPYLVCRHLRSLALSKLFLTSTVTRHRSTRMHPRLFQGLGCLKTPYHIETDPSVAPVVCPPRNQPVALRERLKQTLSEMESVGVIKKVDEPTDWVNSLVVFEKPKSKKLRICLDPRPLNKAIRREHFQLPTLEDITTRLSGARIFSKFDANHGYWQTPLTERVSCSPLSTVHLGTIALSECHLASDQPRRYFRRECANY